MEVWIWLAGHRALGESNNSMTSRGDMTDNNERGLINRRSLLAGTAGWTVTAATASWGAGPAAGAGPNAGAAAVAVFNPYAAKAASGPSSHRVPAVGATPSATGQPYIVPVAPGWSSVSLLTAGNATQSGYVMAGIPDGIGAFANGDGTITLLVNHELSAGRSVVRGHGGQGAFVSRWILDTATLAVRDGSDMVTSPERLHLWSGNGWTTAAAVLAGAPSAAPGAATAAATAPSRADVDIDHLCSADLAVPSAYFDAASGLGYDGHILLNGEETDGRHGRAFAWVDATRSAYELPGFQAGTFASKEDPTPEWENLLASPHSGRRTIVVGNSDGGPSQIYVYVGDKASSGSPIEKAGLVGGRLYSLAMGDARREDRDANIGLKKSLLGKGEGRRVSLVAPGKGTSFLRPEDGAWHPTMPGVYLFVTTDRNNFASPGSIAHGSKATQVGRTRLWAVTFDDITNVATDGSPTARVELLLDGSEGGDMFDNITIDRNGVVYICEDTGDARHGNKIWSYDLRTGKLTVIARLDPDLFGDVVDKRYTPPRLPFTDDKEMSGILDVTALFETAPWFRPGSTVLLVDAQAHFGYDGGQEMGRRIYEGGQLVLLVKAPDKAG